MIRNNIRKIILSFLSVLMCASCSGGNHMIGPRSEDAWKEWDKQQALLKETWGNTEVYAYIQTIMEDLSSLNANVIFKEDFSLESESKELDQLKKTYDDMQWERNGTLKDFLKYLDDSFLHYAIGGPFDLDKIEEKGNGDYDVTLLYYPNADSLMNQNLLVHDNGDGTFRCDFK